ncbi:MAG TPA: hypothetical protein DCZ75_02755 [Geobacter sp.]|nr:hypothetical protein [Geobacter sp.]
MLEQVKLYAQKVKNVLKGRWARHVKGGYLYELDFAAYTGAHVAPNVEGEFKVISLPELPSLSGQVSAEQYRLFESRLVERKDVMIAFLSEDQVLINWAWLSCQPTYYEPIVDYRMEIPEGAVLMYDSQTLSRNLRGAQKSKRSSGTAAAASGDQPKVGVYEASLTNSIRLARELGKKKALAVVVDNNSVPINMLHKLQFKKVKRLRSVQVLGFRCHRATSCI